MGAMGRMFVGVGLALLLGCHPEPREPQRLPYPDRAHGRVQLDGRSLGRHSDIPVTCYDDAPSKDGVVEFHLTLGAGRGQSGKIHIYADDTRKEVDLEVPWSHVVLTPKECPVFDVSITPARFGLGGHLHLDCKLTDTNDTVQADIKFDEC